MMLATTARLLTAMTLCLAPAVHAASPLPAHISPERRYADADDRLNAAYAQLRQRLSPPAFDELRDNQRAWLKLRDRFIADGDDAERNGPGSLPFLWQRTERTVARLAFLEALAAAATTQADGSGRYSDGIARELRLRRIAGVDGHAFFTLIVRVDDLGGTRGIGSVTIAGRASPLSGDRSLTAERDAMSATPEQRHPAELLLQPSADGASVMLSAASGDIFDARLYRVADLGAAIEPMREILRRLPASIFDDTEEGLEERDKTPLLLGGESTPFRLEEPGPDFVRVRYPVGAVDVRRFAGIDGSALVAVSTTNVRVRSLALWRLCATCEDAERVDPAGVFPTLREADFRADATLPDGNSEGWTDFELSQHTDAIHARWQSPPDARQSDVVFALQWNGRAFATTRLQPEGSGP